MSLAATACQQAPQASLARGYSTYRLQEIADVAQLDCISKIKSKMKAGQLTFDTEVTDLSLTRSNPNSSVDYSLVSADKDTNDWFEYSVKVTEEGESETVSYEQDFAVNCLAGVQIEKT